MDTKRKHEEQARLGRLPCLTSDPRRRSVPVGVLLSDEIEYYVDAHKLIDPFDKNNLKPAGYELTIGNEYVLGGEKKELKANKEIRIPPFNVVVIKTAETINLPRFLIARWNVRVRWAYEGLLWVGGPQVDPGWVGHLACPIYNLSDKEVVLRAGDPIALMDFVTTTPFNQGKSLEYTRPPKRVLLEEYGAEELRSALYTEAKTRIGEVEKSTRERIDALEGKMEFFIGSSWVVIGILFTVLSVFMTLERPTIVPVWPNLSAVLSLLALALSFLAWRKSRAQK